MDPFTPAYQAIDERHPKVIYISGKSSTGKTTLANGLRERYGSAVIQLDLLVLEVPTTKDINKFVEIYRLRDDLELIGRFTDLVHDKIHEALKTHPSVVLDGAIATNETLRETIGDWADDFLFIYLSPTSTAAYVERLKDRFVLATRDHNSGLPRDFWKHFTESQLEEYYTTKEITSELLAAITSYAIESMTESSERLQMFSKTFDDILVLEI